MQHISQALVTAMSSRSSRPATSPDYRPLPACPPSALPECAGGVDGRKTTRKFQVARNATSRSGKWSLGREWSPRRSGRDSSHKRFIGPLNRLFCSGQGEGQAVRGRPCRLTDDCASNSTSDSAVLPVKARRPPDLATQERAGRPCARTAVRRRACLNTG